MSPVIKLGRLSCSMALVLSIFSLLLPPSSVDGTVCTDKTVVVRSIVACLPAWWRFAQCLRRYRDTKEMFPHLVNAFKYATTFFVVTFSCLTHSYKGELLYDLQLPPLMETEYKWESSKTR